MGTSKTTLYRKISEAGIDVSTLRGADGQITDDGFTTLSALLDGTLQRRTVSRQDDAPDASADAVNLMGKIETLKRHLDETRAALDAANAPDSRITTAGSRPGTGKRGRMETL